MGDVVEHCSCVIINGATVTQTLEDCLPPGSYIITHQDVAGVDKHNFERWGRDFAKECEHLTSNGRKVLLLYDGYRSHLGLKTLEILKSNSIIAYALPAHTSGVTQPLDLSVFNSFKRFVRKGIVEAGKFCDKTDYDLFYLCLFLRTAYERSFTRENILSDFRKAGINPLGPGDLLSVSRPASKEQLSTMVSVEELSLLLEKKRQQLGDGIQLQVAVVRRGFIDTSEGLNLTSDTAMELVHKKETEEKAKKMLAALKKSTKDQKELIRFEATRKARLEIEWDALLRRVPLYNVPLKHPRSMKERRLLARKKTQERRVHGVEGTPGSTGTG